VQFDILSIYPRYLIKVNQEYRWLDGMQSPVGGWMSIPPHRQIIGFARFRTRHDALAALDTLQGMCVDVQKGSLLQAELARNNLPESLSLSIMT